MLGNNNCTRISIKIKKIFVRYSHIDKKIFKILKITKILLTLLRDVS